VEHPELKQVLSLDDLEALQRAVLAIYVDPALVSYAVDIATATRDPAGHGLAELAQYISYGASPRGPISLVQGARALALIRGREYAVVEDLQALARDALRHRLVLSYQALAEEVSSDSILEQVLQAVPVPQLDLARVSAA
jgi:MoxR-like ATPase